MNLKSLAALAAAASLFAAPIAAAQEAAAPALETASLQRAGASMDEASNLWGVDPLIWIGGGILLGLIIWQVIESETCCNAEPLSP